MTLDDLPDYVTASDLELYGITPADVRRRCPHATTYGAADEPYWHRDDLGPLMETPEGGDEQ